MENVYFTSYFLSESINNCIHWNSNLSRNSLQVEIIVNFSDDIDDDNFG